MNIEHNFKRSLYIIVVVLVLILSLYKLCTDPINALRDLSNALFLIF